MAGRSYPRRTLEAAIRVPRALADNNGGNPWKSAEVAKALNLGPSSGNFFYLTSASQHYGLTEGTRDTAQIAMTELGRRVVYPSSAEEEATAKREAFLSVDNFRKVLAHFGGNNLPEQRFLSNILRETFSIPEDQQDEFVEIFQKNCKYLGIGATFDLAKGGPAGPGRRQRDSRPPLDGAPESGTITVGSPESGDDSPICFVVMPFTEREDAHVAGFFDEVLEELFTPAAMAAGFQVQTAKRQGSDLIQSTIVNDLLEADLVLADLTEHNPNVLFELGLRIMEEKPVVLVKATGTGRIFDVDSMLRVLEYNPNLWPSTVRQDISRISEHIQGAWDSRDSGRTFMSILRHASSAEA